MKAIDISDRLELLVDDALIERRTGTEHRLHSPTPHEVVMENVAPWEGNGCGYHTILRDGDLYRMYYKAWQIDLKEKGITSGHPCVTCYAESHDGIRWEKPALGIVEFEGSNQNNIIWEGPAAHNFTPFRDDTPGVTDDCRYKAVGSETRDRQHGLYPFKSADGIHWSRMSDEPIITDGYFDSQNLVFRDTVRDEYRAYYRSFHGDPNVARGHRRDIKTAVTRDFRQWPQGEWLVYPDAPVEQLYTNQVEPYFRAPHLFIGFPARYVERCWSPAIEDLPELTARRARSNSGERYGTAVTDTVFMSSRDGLTFKRWGEAFIRPGLRPVDSWVYGDMYTAWHVLQTPSDIQGTPDELSIYATESYFRGNSNLLRRYTLRMDGFVSLTAPRSGGEFVTKPLRFAGDGLAMNFSASAAGSVRVEILDGSSDSVVEGFGLNDCVELLGDDLERRVKWTSGKDLAALADRAIRLRVVMVDADLFAFQFGNA